MVSLPLSVYVCVCVCVCVRACVCVRVGVRGTCEGGVRFSNSNRITHSDYRILLLLKMHIPSIYRVLTYSFSYFFLFVSRFE